MLWLFNIHPALFLGVKLATPAAFILVAFTLPAKSHLCDGSTVLSDRELEHVGERPGGNDFEGDWMRLKSPSI